MSDPNLSIYGAIQTPDIAGTASQYQKLQQSADLHPQQLALNAANIQSRLTQNERDAIALDQEAKDNEFRKYLDTTPPIKRNDGSIDEGATYKQLVDNGYGRYALQHIAQQTAGYVNQAQSRDQVSNIIGKAATTVAQAYQGAKPEDRAKTAAQTDAYLKQTYGIAPSDLYGQNWMDALPKAALDQTAYEQNQRANIDAYNTPEAKDVNSTQNKAFREYVRQTAPGMHYQNLTLFDAKNIPGLKDTILSFTQSQGERAGAYSEATKVQADIAGMDTLAGQFKEAKAKFGLRIGETLSQVFARITNSEDQAALQQLVDSAAQYGIKYDPKTPIDGVMQELQRQRNIRAAQLDRLNQQSQSPSREPAVKSPAQSGQKVGSSSSGDGTVHYRLSRDMTIGGKQFKAGQVVNISQNNLNNPVAKEVAANSVRMFK